MPRPNITRSNEVRAWNAHREYLEEKFEGATINEGWGQGPGFISSKVYTLGVVTTNWPEEAEDQRLIEPEEFKHSFEPFEEID